MRGYTHMTKMTDTTIETKTSTQTAYPHIEKIIHDNAIVLFMKGNEARPNCGYSATVVRILHHLKAPFYSVDILEDPALRQDLKDFSQWPTFPQLYINGVFVGGCDIVCQLLETGELQTLVAAVK